MARDIDAAEVAKHNNAESCWVILYGHVWDVTKLIPLHPGGSSAILDLAGRDATREFDPVHADGTLEAGLPPEAKLGRVRLSETASQVRTSVATSETQTYISLDTLLNLNDIEKEATKRMPHRGWAYYYSAADDLVSKELNNTIYRSILLRPRIFVDCVECSTDTQILGHETSTPIFVSPAAMARLAHVDGEVGIARACGKYGAVQIISQNASMTPEQIVDGALPGQIFGWQLYVQQDRKKSEDMLERIEKLKSRIKFIVLTLDAPVPGKREHDEKAKNVGANPSVASATKKSSNAKSRGGIGAQLFQGTAADLTWERTLPWLAKHTTLPVVLKGIQTHEDAYLASRHTPLVRGIILSNHGGRAADTAPPSVHTLLEIRKYVPQVFARLEVFVDGGIRRGTDIIKALCLGAKAVGIGRPALFGLGAGGQAGVERVFEILQDELSTAMRLLGVSAISQLGLRHINIRMLEQQIYNGPSALDDQPKTSKL